MECVLNIKMKLFGKLLICPTDISKVDLIKYVFPMHELLRCFRWFQKPYYIRIYGSYMSKILTQFFFINQKNQFLKLRLTSCKIE